MASGSNGHGGSGMTYSWADVEVPEVNKAVLTALQLE